jgi:hypothetical protein
MPDFNIIDVTVTHTYHYDPSEYLECCEQNGIAPTEAGIIDFIQDEDRQTSRSVLIISYVELTTATTD